MAPRLRQLLARLLQALDGIAQSRAIDESFQLLGLASDLRRGAYRLGASLQLLATTYNGAGA